MSNEDLVIYPRCHPYWIIDGEKVENNEELCGQKIAYTATGHLLPCCWLDNENKDPRQKLDTLLTDELLVENNESIEDIITSDAWRFFHKTLLDFPEISPRTCQKMCGHNPKKRVRNMSNAS